MKLRSKLSILWICIMFVFIGCGKSKEETEPLKVSAFKLNTMVEITLYDNKKQEILDKVLALCDYYENIYSRTLESSELYELNHRLLEEVEGISGAYYVSNELATLLEQGMYYSKLSKGAFDITIGPVSSLWDFTGEEDIVPSEDSINEGLQWVGYENFSIQGNIATFANEKVQVDLGAIAKGYIADSIKDLLIEEGVSSAIINLGGNVLCVGEKVVEGGERAPFHIGIQKPFADRNELVSVMDINGQSVVSSGIYERSFTVDGEFYHHLINTATGYPLDNGIIGVTIISDKSVDGDGLSTSLFALGVEEGLKLIESMEHTYAAFITEDYKIHYSKDLQENIKVSPVE